MRQELAQGSHKGKPYGLLLGRSKLGLSAAFRATLVFTSNFLWTFDTGPAASKAASRHLNSIPTKPSFPRRRESNLNFNEKVRPPPSRG